MKDKDNSLKKIKENDLLFRTDDEIKKFDPETEKKTILENSHISKIINRLKLTKEQINQGMNHFQKYYNHLQTHNNKEPNWKITLNEANQIDIDLSNDLQFKKSKYFDNFWLTNITPLDDDLEKYFSIPDLKKPRSILVEANQAILKFPKPLSQAIIDITYDLKNKKGILLIDDEFIHAKKIFKYLATLFGTNKSKTVSIIDLNDLNNFFYTNMKMQNYINNDIINYLNDVDYLFLNRLGVGLKSEWFINTLINILLTREANNKITFISCPIDIFISKFNLINHYNDSINNSAIDKVEDLLKATIKRTTNKFVAKKS